jgi:hypothetical protein
MEAAAKTTRRTLGFLGMIHLSMLDLFPKMS